jgi:hypothetical protein
MLLLYKKPLLLSVQDPYRKPAFAGEDLKRLLCN